MGAKDKKGKGKDDKGNGNGDAKKNDGKGGKKHVDSEGRPLRCVNFWFGCCKNHPLKEGEKCQYGDHVGNPREEEKQRPYFKKMEAIHGPWERGKFKHASTIAAAKKKAEAGGDKAGNGGQNPTPVVSPR